MTTDPKVLEALGKAVLVGIVKIQPPVGDGTGPQGLEWGDCQSIAEMIPEHIMEALQKLGYEITKPVQYEQSEELSLFRERLPFLNGGGSVRGRQTVWDDRHYPPCHVWRDNGKPVPIAGGKERPCTFCGLTADRRDGVDGADPCLGILPRVESACCGHGVHEGWIRFENGPTLRVVVDYPGTFRSDERYALEAT